jgi:hypothetical protein
MIVVMFVDIVCTYLRTRILTRFSGRKRFDRGASRERFACTRSSIIFFRRIGQTCEARKAAPKHCHSILPKMTSRLYAWRTSPTPRISGLLRSTFC